MVVLRFMRTTHYQVGHPIYHGFLIHSCTSPRESKTEQSIIQDIYKTLGSHGYKCSREAAKFLVRMARHMDFLELNNIWTWKAFVIDYFERLDDMNHIYKETRILTIARKIIYLKYYLESDGAFLIKFAREALNRREKGLKRYTIRYTDEIVEPIFKDVINDYLAIEKDFRKRVQLRNFFEAVDKRGYRPKVRIHKAFPHLDPLVDLDILDYEEGQKPKENKYLPKLVKNRNLTKIFLEKFSSVASLEGISLFENGNFEKAAQYDVKSGYFERVAELYDIPHHRYSQSKEKIIFSEIVRVYSKIKDEVTGLASIRTIKDIVCTIGLVNHKVLLEWPDIDCALEEMKREEGANLRFHVDRTGEKAYIVLSK